MIAYEKLLIVQSQIFTNLLLLVYIWSNLKLFVLLVFRFDLFDKRQTGIQSLLKFW
jgi:hypothetical protein